MDHIEKSEKHICRKPVISQLKRVNGNIYELYVVLFARSSNTLTRERERERERERDFDCSVVNYQLS